MCLLVTVLFPMLSNYNYFHFAALNATFYSPLSKFRSATWSGWYSWRFFTSSIYWRACNATFSFYFENLFVHASILALHILSTCIFMVGILNNSCIRDIYLLGITMLLSYSIYFNGATAYEGAVMFWTVTCSPNFCVAPIPKLTR